MPYSIVDTNVPLIAAGHSDALSESCRSQCVAYIERILCGEISLVIDDANEILVEYGNNIDARNRSTDIDCLFLIHLFDHQFNPDLVRRMQLIKRGDDHYEDYPDNAGNWTSEIPRCERFDPDDKKWVALAVRFKKDTGTDAPIVNAADRCWLAFEPHLAAAGIKQEFLCRGER